MTYTLTIADRAQIITDENQRIKSRMKLVGSIKDLALSNHKEECILIEDNIKPQQMIQMCLDRNIKHILQNSKIPLVEKIQTADQIFFEPIKFLAFNQKLFMDCNDSLMFGFHSKENRTDLVNRVLQFLKIDAMNHNSEHILKTTEELIMNAQVHAPRIGDFKSPHNMSFLVEKKNDFVALSVFDDYGSMNINKFLNKILNAFTIGTANAINYGVGGAGLGSSIIFESAEVLYIAVLPKRITRVTVLTPIKIRAKDREFEQKSIHIINSL